MNGAAQRGDLPEKEKGPQTGGPISSNRVHPHCSTLIDNLRIRLDALSPDDSASWKIPFRVARCVKSALADAGETPEKFLRGHCEMVMPALERFADRTGLNPENLAAEIAALWGRVSTDAVRANTIQEAHARAVPAKLPDDYPAVTPKFNRDSEIILGLFWELSKGGTLRVAMPSEPLAALLGGGCDRRRVGRILSLLCDEKYLVAMPPEFKKANRYFATDRTRALFGVPSTGNEVPPDTDAQGMGSPAAQAPPPMTEQETKIADAIRRRFETRTIQHSGVDELARALLKHSKTLPDRLAGLHHNPANLDNKRLAADPVLYFQYPTWISEKTAEWDLWTGDLAEFRPGRKHFKAWINERMRETGEGLGMAEKILRVLHGTED